jgi:plastocyanin
VNAGPTLTSAFHVIGTMFNTYPDGNPANVIYGDQTYNIPPGGAAMFEMQIPDAGLYPFVTHAFAYTGRGAVGLIKVDPNAPAAPGSYPAMGDPFSAGTKPFVPPATAPSQGTASTAPAAGGTAMPSAAPSPASAGPATSCSKPSKTLRIAAENSAYDTDCLAAVAKQPLTIKFDNKDAGVPHNVAFYTDESATKALFNGEIVTGATTTTYKVDALSPGTYFFRCDVHPTTMKGTLTVS